jgi:hypothetical protein
VGDEQEPRPPQHINASASGHAQMPIAAGNMINYWGDAANQRDFRLHLHHEADEVVLEPDRATPFAIEIRNDAASEQRLELLVPEMPDRTYQIRTADGVLHPKGKAIVSVPPSADVVATLIVRCRPQEPPAGPRDISVFAADPANRQRYATSRPKRVRVLPKPALKLDAAPFTQVPGTMRYTTQVAVTNSGNARVAGTIEAVPPAPAGQVPPWRAACEGSFELLPGASGSVTVSVALIGRGLGERTLRVPLRAAVDRDGVTLEPDHLELVDRGLGQDLQEAAAAFVRWGRRPVTAPRGLLASGAVGLVVLVLLLSNCQGPGTRAASPSPTARSSAPRVAMSPTPEPSEAAAYSADWPGLPCGPFDGGAAGPTGSLCRFGGAELYLWSYPSHDARKADRDKRTALDAKGCATQSRHGTWTGSGGRGGQYLEYSVTDTTGQCWARIWWDGGDNDPASVDAAMLSAKWDADLHGSWDPLRSVWLSHGYQFGA